MPIIVDRRTGEMISKPEYSQQQIDAAWEIIIKTYVHRHPEIFEESLTENDSEEIEI